MSAVSSAKPSIISPTPALPSFSLRWTHLTRFFLDPAHNSPRTLVGRVVWLKSVVVAVFLCIPVVGHVLWLFPCTRFQVSAPVSRVVVGSEQIPEVGLPNLGNTCWMNAVLQCVLRSPTLVTRIIAIGKGAKPTELIVLLNELIAAMRAGTDTQRVLQELVTQAKGCCRSGLEGQADGGNFLNQIIRDAKCELQELRMQRGNVNADLHHSDSCWKTAWSSKNPTFVETMLYNVELDYQDKSPDSVHNTAKRYLTKVPPVLFVHLNVPSQNHWQDKAPFPHRIDFAPVFTDELRAKLGKEVTYRLVAAGVYYGDGRSGHHTAQQINPPNYYDDSSASPATSDQIDARLRSSLTFVWEIEDSSLVDSCYNLSAP